MKTCTCDLSNGTHAPDCKPAADVAFAELYISVLSAEDEWQRNPSKTTREKYFSVSREYSRVLRERLDAKAAAR